MFLFVAAWSSPAASDGNGDSDGNGNGSEQSQAAEESQGSGDDGGYDGGGGGGDHVEAAFDTLTPPNAEEVNDMPPPRV